MLGIVQRYKESAILEQARQAIEVGIIIRMNLNNNSVGMSLPPQDKQLLIGSCSGFDPAQRCFLTLQPAFYSENSGFPI